MAKREGPHTGVALHPKVETGAHTQQILIQCAQSSHAVEKGRSQNELHALKTHRMTSWSVVLFRRYWYSLKGDIFSAANRHGLEKKKNKLMLFSNHDRSLLRQQPGARDMAWLEAQLVQSHASIKTLCQQQHGLS